MEPENEPLPQPRVPRPSTCHIPRAALRRPARPRPSSHRARPTPLPHRLLHRLARRARRRHPQSQQSLRPLGRPRIRPRPRRHVRQSQHRRQRRQQIHNQARPHPRRSSGIFLSPRKRFRPRLSQQTRFENDRQRHAAQTSRARRTTAPPEKWNGIFFIYNRTGKEALLSKAVLRMRNNEKELPQLSQTTIAGIPALKVQRKTETTYWVEHGKYAASANDPAVLEQILPRLEGATPPDSLSQSAAYPGSPISSRRRPRTLRRRPCSEK